eukprot:TRINITY_DN3396_c0_g1_i1.p1 TRINITY_DN3396_c0_g1~~TRINITY_DN3396_c0_g1_i1.p1  ORF type:complete len:334 (+),score=64.81 TRINITY_DN3396_c0_g1_i1:145-1002(+)
MVQIDSSASFTVTGPDGESMSAHITYSSNELLVLRKEDQKDKWISEVLDSINVSPFMPRLEVWKRTSGQAAAVPSTASPISLWRFGLPASALGTTTGDTNMVSLSSSPTDEPSRNPSLLTWFFVAVLLVSAMFFSVVFFILRLLSWKPKQPRLASTELASYGESNSAHSPSMDEEQQCQTSSPTDDSSSWFSLARIRAMLSSALAEIDRMLKSQQQQDKYQIDKQAAEIEALKEELAQLKAELAQLRQRRSEGGGEVPSNVAVQEQRLEDRKPRRVRLVDSVPRR